MNPLPFAACILAGVCVLYPRCGQTQEDQDLNAYYPWFQRHAQTASLYGNHAQLYVFAEDAPLFARPDAGSAQLCNLAPGSRVTSLLPPGEVELLKGPYLGLEELWYRVEHCSNNGGCIQGYMWGADLAKGWRITDLDRDNQQEMLLLGVSSSARLKQGEIAAELKWIRQGKVLLTEAVPGLCIFEACGVTPLLRVIYSSYPDQMVIIEASALHIGCQQGLARAFLHWNGSVLERVYQAEWVGNKELLKKTFIHRSADPSGASYICQYSHEDEAYNPVWNCTLMDGKPAKKATKPSRAR